MVPNVAMGAMQAMESCVILVNEIGKVLDSSVDGKLQRESLKEALSRYVELRAPRSGAIQKRAGIVCRALLRHDGHNADAEKLLNDLPNLTDADWLFKEFMGFLGAPALDSIPLSKRGKLFHNTLSAFQQALKA